MGGGSSSSAKNARARQPEKLCEGRAIPNILAHYFPNDDKRFIRTRHEYIDLRMQLKPTHIIEVGVCVQVSKGDPRNILLAVKQQVEVSVDCVKCKRRHRTVVFNHDGTSKCTGSSGNHEYFGQILQSASYLIEPKSAAGDDSQKQNPLLFSMYSIGVEWEPFTDTKYETQSETNPFGGGTGWGRIGFDFQCTKCKKSVVAKSVLFSPSVQTNSGYDGGRQISTEGPIANCSHITCDEYIAENVKAQPFLQCTKVVGDYSAEIAQGLYAMFMQIIPKSVLDLVVEFANNDWYETENQ